MESKKNIKKDIVDFNQQVGWNNLTLENSSAFTSQILNKAVALNNEVQLEQTKGINKYDASLEMAEIYINLQSLAAALDIDLYEAVNDKMLINKARYLNDNYKQSLYNASPNSNRYYKITNKFVIKKCSREHPLRFGQILGLTDENGVAQQVYIIDEPKEQSQYMLKIIAVIHPENDTNPIWIASESQLDRYEISYCLNFVDFFYEIEML